MKLYEALNIKDKEIIALVGAGGKTTTMYALARDLKQRKKVLLSTTTSIYFPDEKQVAKVVVGKDIERRNTFLKENANLNKVVGLGRRVTTEGKLAGVSPEELDEIYMRGYFDYILVEADGAKHRALKAPAAHEPVIPYGSTIVIIVVGIDACGSIFSEETVHRPQSISEITGIQIGQKITPEIIGKIVTEKNGLLKGVPNASRVFLLINKVDSDARYAMAYETAKIVRARAYGRIEKVLLCNMMNEQVLEIL